VNDALHYQLYIFPTDVPKDDEAVLFSAGPYPHKSDLALLLNKDKRITLKINQKEGKR
jgi:hypothetical protein